MHFCQPPQERHAFFQDFLTVAGNGPPNRKCGRNFRREGDKTLHHELALKSYINEGAKHRVSVNCIGTRNTPVTF
jgi:hypothetical protein